MEHTYQISLCNNYVRNYVAPLLPPGAREERAPFRAIRAVGPLAAHYPLHKTAITYTLHNTSSSASESRGRSSQEAVEGPKGHRRLTVVLKRKRLFREKPSRSGALTPRQGSVFV